MTRITSQTLRLLEEGDKEQVYQEFLEKHTRFIPRDFVQNHGIGCGLVLRKLAFGADYKSDFFFFSKSSDDWNAVFIELEKPSSQFFKGNTDEFHPDFLKALQQINQWKAWFLSEQNRGSFLSTVSAIQVPEHMARNPTYNKYVLVFGRRSQYEGNENRRRLVRTSEHEDFKIITFDSLMEDLSAKPKVSIGSRHNQYIDILTDEITNPSLYSWVEPTRLRVSKKLHEKLKNGPRSQHYVLDNGNQIEALTHAAPLVRIRPG
jgi:hypothetical protein